jgi:hypothetical protein
MELNPATIMRVEPGGYNWYARVLGVDARRIPRRQLPRFALTGKRTNTTNKDGQDSGNPSKTT